MNEFGRAPYVTEVEAAEIRKINKAKHTAFKKHCLEVRREIEDWKAAKELNQHRMIG